MSEATIPMNFSLSLPEDIVFIVHDQGLNVATTLSRSSQAYIREKELVSHSMYMVCDLTSFTKEPLSEFKLID